MHYKQTSTVEVKLRMTYLYINVTGVMQDAMH